MIGGMEINPRNLLDEGLRKELVRQLSAALHFNLQFRMKAKLGLKDHQEVCVRVFNNLERNIDGFRRALSWLQDYLRIDGMAFFSDEITRVVIANIE
jgi:WASH complex subunit strumpellin